MKKLTYKRKIFLIKNATRIEKNKIKREKKAELFIQKKGSILEDNEYIVQEKLDLRDNYESTLGLIKKIYLSKQDRDRFRYLNFDFLKSISPSAALLLAAHLDHYQIIKNRKLVPKTDTWDENIFILLNEMGLFELMKSKNMGAFSTKVEERPDTIFLKFQNGYINSIGSDSNDPVNSVLTLKEKISQFCKSIKEESLLYEALTEAITNVSQHAYDNSKKNFHKKYKKKYFWMFAAFHIKERILHVVFYDIGIGLVNTIVTKSWYEEFRDSFTKITDADKIQLAIEKPRSSTGRANRGLGLRDMLDFIKQYDDGEFMVVSGKGACIVTADKSDDLSNKNVKYSQRLFSSSLPGTLIRWKVRLP